jgi:seryl-tRNA synthetase
MNLELFVLIFLQLCSNDISGFVFQALKSVEEVVLRLENLLQELHASSASSGKEHLKAAYSVLEKIQKLKKEAKFLEASFSAKEDSLQEVCLHLFRLLCQLVPWKRSL